MNPPFVQMTPQQQQQRGLLLVFLLVFFVLTSGPGELRHNARRNRMESIQDEKRNLELKKTSVKDAIILDLSKSNEILELENKQLKISVIGLMQKLRGIGGGGEDFISELKEEFNLTSSFSGLGSIGPSSNGSKSRNNKDNSEKEMMLELPGRSIDDARMRREEEEEEEGGGGESASSTKVPRRAFIGDKNVQ